MKVLAYNTNIPFTPENEIGKDLLKLLDIEVKHINNLKDESSSLSQIDYFLGTTLLDLKLCQDVEFTMCTSLSPKILKNNVNMILNCFNLDSVLQEIALRLISLEGDGVKKLATYLGVTEIEGGLVL